MCLGCFLVYVFSNGNTAFLGRIRVAYGCLLRIGRFMAMWQVAKQPKRDCKVMVVCMMDQGTKAFENDESYHVCYA